MHHLSRQHASAKSFKHYSTKGRAFGARRRVGLSVSGDAGAWKMGCRTSKDVAEELDAKWREGASLITKAPQRAAALLTEAAQMALRLGYPHSAAELFLAAACISRGRLGLPLYRQSIAADPDREHAAHTCLKAARTCEREGLVDAAAEYYRRAARSNRSLEPECDVRVACLSILKSDFEDARSRFEKLAAGGDSRMLFKAALCAHLTGDDVPLYPHLPHFARTPEYKYLCALRDEKLLDCPFADSIDRRLFASIRRQAMASAARAAEAIEPSIPTADVPAASARGLAPPPSARLTARPSHSEQASARLALTLHALSTPMLPTSMLPTAMQVYRPDIALQTADQH